MKANPGGQIPSAEVVGRDGLIQKIWRSLERQSVILTAERRMGKTSIAKKMVEEGQADKLPIYRDLEGIRNPIDFIQVVLRDVETYLGRMRRTAQRTRKFLSDLSGLEIGGFGTSIKIPEIATPHWKELLTKTFEDLEENKEQTIVFFWDELPLMLYDIKRSSGEELAMELLDTLRALRQDRSQLRMVFTGSIGLHHVLHSLKRSGYANDPTNDMDTVEVTPLAEADAQELAKRLIEGEEIRTDDISSLARSIAETVDGIPYFVHLVVDKLVGKGEIANSGAVEKIVSTALTDPQDRWHLSHYIGRVNQYYTTEEQPFAFALLDVLASAQSPLSFAELFNLTKTHLVTEDEEGARNVLSLLRRDHYVVQQSDGKFCFHFPLIQRSWRLQRGLV